MSTIKSHINYIYNAETGEFIQEIEKASDAVEENSKVTEKSDGILSKSTKVWLGVTAAVTGAAAAFDSVASPLLTFLANDAKVRNSLNLTTEEMKTLNSENEKMAAKYGLTGKEISDVNALNSEYVGSAKEAADANKLVAQTAVLYAQKEGDVTKAGEQALTAQEALRDVILTGNTTAFEDAGISLEGYSDAIIANTGFTQEQIDVITEGTNGQLEYTEALSKAATPQQRFAALSFVVNAQLEGMNKNLSPLGKKLAEYEESVTKVKNALGKLAVIFVIVILFILGFAKSIVGAIVQSDLFTAVIDLLQNNFKALLIIVGLVIIGIIVYKSQSMLATVSTFLYGIAISVLTIIKKLFKLETYKNIIAIIIERINILITNIAIGIQTTLTTLTTIAKSLLKKETYKLIAAKISEFAIFVATNLIFIAIIATIGILIYWYLSTHSASEVLTDITNGLKIALDFLYGIVLALWPLIQVLGTIVLNVATAVFPVLVDIVIALYPLLQAIWEIVTLLWPIVEKLGKIILDTLVVAFETLAPIIDFVVGIFTKLLDIVVSVTDAIVGGLIGALNKIPFVSIGEDKNLTANRTISVIDDNSGLNGLDSNSILKSSNGGLSKFGIGGSNTFITNNIINNNNKSMAFDVKTTKSISATQLARDSIFMSRNKGVFI